MQNVSKFRFSSDPTSSSSNMTKQALYLVEHKAREAVATRADIHRELLHNAKQAKEAELRNLARLARADRVNLNNDNKTSVENGETFSFLALSL